jgi:hypothetical protein
MQIRLMPFRHVKAFTDLASGVTYVNQNISDVDELRDCLAHEVAHQISNDPDHTDRWCEVAESFGLKRPDNDLFERYRQRFGIPKTLAANIGNITGSMNLLTDFVMLQQYRKTASKYLSTEGHWEVINEVNGNETKQLIRLYPTPKGVFPVAVVYMPVVSHFRSPQARLLVYKMMLAQVKQQVGAARRKLGSLPAGDGGSINLDGEALLAEGKEEEKELYEQAINLGEPMPIMMF